MDWIWLTVIMLIVLSSGLLTACLIYRSKQLRLVQELERLKQMHSMQDPLTGLPNRKSLIYIIKQVIEEARDHNQITALFLVNLDRFSSINDAFGRNKGDEFLVKVSQRFKTYLPKGSELGRIAGDEFVIVKNHLTSKNDAELFIENLIKDMSQPFVLNDQQLNITYSTGIALFPMHGEDPDRLLANANKAMIRIKDQGKNNYQFYSPDLNFYSLNHLKFENELRNAIRKNKFVLHYQPVFNLTDLTPVGVEALIRWEHPEKGLVQPLEFIPLSEELGLIQAIGEWTLINACQDMTEWREAGLKGFKIAVNVSSVQFRLNQLKHSIANALKTTHLPSSCLELELTESALLEGSEEVNSTLNHIKAMGVNIVIDDFGTRYSCLHYLKRLKIDKLKIDKSFIMELPGNTDDQTLVKTIITMAKDLGIEVLAEGIETKAQLDLLRELGCDYGQGFYFSKPLPKAQLSRFLKQL